MAPLFPHSQLKQKNQKVLDVHSIKCESLKRKTEKTGFLSLSFPCPDCLIPSHGCNIPSPLCMFPEIFCFRPELLLHLLFTQIGLSPHILHLAIIVFYNKKIKLSKAAPNHCCLNIFKIYFEIVEDSQVVAKIVQSSHGPFTQLPPAPASDNILHNHSALSKPGN